MRVHVIRNAWFEGPGAIGEWAAARGHAVTECLASEESYPAPEDVDLLVVLGGPMSADDHESNPWLETEKRFLLRLVEEGVPVLGICLGAQILAEVLGGTVKRGSEPEIGFYPVFRPQSARPQRVLAFISDGMVVGHWHGDTFDLPAGVDSELSSEVTANQAFVSQDGRLVGLQCHLEWTAESLDRMLAECAEDLAVGLPHVMSSGEMREMARERLEAGHRSLYSVLDELAG